MRRIILRRAAVVLLLVLVAAACGDDDEELVAEGGVLTRVQARDAVSRAMPEVEDLPGSGWRLTAEDDFDEDDNDEFSSQTEAEPACAEVRALEGFGKIFSDGDEEGEEEDWLARGQREFERSSAGQAIPMTVEVEVEVSDAAQAGAFAGLMEQFMEGDAFQSCFVAVMETVFSEAAGGGEVEITARDVSSNPGDGMAFGFDMIMSMAGVEFDMAMEFHFWTREGAQVTTMVAGPREELERSFVDDVLSAVDARVSAAVDV
jgi:hypothetical protein